jgi:DNA-directed RNA polymerase II subunit RPB2
MGVYVTNYENRMDKTAYVLNYPMKPLVDTRIMNLIQLNKIPSGTQVIVAIMTHTGYNQEDAIIMNKNSVEEAFNSIIIKNEKCQESHRDVPGERCDELNDASYHDLPAYSIATHRHSSEFK